MSEVRQTTTVVIRPNVVVSRTGQGNVTAVHSYVGLPGRPGSAADGSSYQRNFTQVDLSITGILPVTHLLGSKPSAVLILDNTGAEVDPDNVQVPSIDAIAVDLSSFTPLPGTWTILIGA